MVGNQEHGMRAMLKTCIKFGALLSAILLFSGEIDAQTNTESETTVSQFLSDVEMSGNWFIAYRNGYRQIHADDENIPDELIRSSKFILKRSYFTLKKDLNETFSVRYTQDLTVDTEGGDAGNVETRLKYLYVKMSPVVNSNVFTGTWAEVGMVHRPWLDYEQKINSYRVQDNMAVERARIFNSADFGMVFGGNIGPKMDKKFLSEVSNAMQGKYLSYVIGLYNGGGYSGAEKNINKVVAGRLSWRPLPEALPYIQLSGYFNVGKGNIEASPDFNQVLGFIAFTGKQLTLTTQYHTGVGDFRGRYVAQNDPTKALKNEGFSFFGEYKIPKTEFAVWGRYDFFDVETLDSKTTRYIAGLAYRINKNLRFVVNTEGTTIAEDTENVYEANLEISF